MLMAVLSRLLQAAVIAWAVFWSSPLLAGEAQYAYDELGRLTTVVDEAGNTAIYNYESKGDRFIFPGCHRWADPVHLRPQWESPHGHGRQDSDHDVHL